MSETFRELTPEEIKYTTLQFIGQNLVSELKELDSNIVSRNNTLQGKTIDPVRIVNSVPIKTAAPGVNAAPIAANVVNAGINVSSPITATTTSSEPNIKYEADQLEFDFNKTAKYDDIHNDLITILDKIKRIEEKIDKILENNN